MEELDLKNLYMEKKKKIGEIIPEHVIVKLNKVPIVFIYKSITVYTPQLRPR